MTTKKQSVCDHKFVGSKCCLKCGWVPSAAVYLARLNPMHVVVAAPALSAEERAERAWKTEYPVTAAAEDVDEKRGYTKTAFAACDVSEAFKAGYLARDKEKP